MSLVYKARKEYLQGVELERKGRLEEAYEAYKSASEKRKCGSNVCDCKYITENQNAVVK